MIINIPWMCPSPQPQPRLPLSLLVVDCGGRNEVLTLAEILLGLDKFKAEQKVWAWRGESDCQYSRDSLLSRGLFAMTFLYPMSLSQLSGLNDDFIQVFIWRRQVKLWRYACHKNERESLSSEISFCLGMDACPLKLQCKGGTNCVTLIKAGERLLSVSHFLPRIYRLGRNCWRVRTTFLEV